jgi:serine/threonine-protein kinase
MAEIYLARMIGTDGFSKLVVVKRLLQNLANDKEFVEMFLDEARINARLSHSNVVQVLDLGETDGQYYMAMEYVTGLSVAQVGRMAAQRLGEVPQGVACGIVAQACAGLHHAHETKLPDGSEMGIIHRDVSPQNLLLTYEGFVKVLDFGIAKAEGRATQTKAGMVKGKFAYMSPEQCTGEGIDRRTDIFALGIILFELCTSRRLFKRNSTFETYEAIIKCEVPDPSTVSASVSKPVAAVILKTLSRKKEDRFPNAEAMQEALELAMRRSTIRGKSTDLARFLENNFSDQIKEQEELIRRLESGALAGKEHEHDAEASQLAENYAALVEEELEEIDDGPTQNEEKANESKQPPQPPAVPSLNRQNAPIANLPVSMVLPIIDPKQVVKDLIAGKPVEGLSPTVMPQPRTPSAPVSLPPASTSNPPASISAPPLQAPQAHVSGAGFSPVMGVGPAISSGQGMAPGAASSGYQAALGAQLQQNVASRPSVPPGFLEKVANLPLAVLIAIGLVLAALTAGITALVMF